MCVRLQSAHGPQGAAEPGACTSDTVAPGLDLLYGAGNAVATGFLIDADKKAFAAGTGVAAAAFIASAAYGYTQTSKCADALDAAAERSATKVDDAVAQAESARMKAAVERARAAKAAKAEPQPGAAPQPAPAEESEPRPEDPNAPAP